jgi:hypothetical protein
MGGKWSNWGRQAVEMEGLICEGGALGLFLCLVAHFFGWAESGWWWWLVTGRDQHAIGRIAGGKLSRLVKCVQADVLEGK